MFKFIKNLLFPTHKTSSVNIGFPEYKPKAPMKDKRDSKCPYCNDILDKIPSAKKKCLNCGNYIFVRTLPNRDRVLCTEEEKNKIDFIEKTKPFDFWANKNEIRYIDKNAELLINLKNSYLISKNYNVRAFLREFYTKLIEINLLENNKFTLYTAYTALSDLDRAEGKDPSYNKKLAQKYTTPTNIKFN